MKQMAENMQKYTANRVGTFQYRVNQIAILGICAWVIIPSVRVRVNDYIMIAVLGLWLITTDLKWLTEKWTKDMVFLVLFFATFIPYAITGNLRYGGHGPRMIIVLFPLFFMGIFINHYYMYYKKDYNTLGKIALVSLVSFIIGAAQTVLGLRTYPNAARLLANGVTDIAVKDMYSRMGIGGYEFVYAGCFLLVVAMYPLVRSSAAKKTYKFLCAGAFLAAGAVIATASFTIALLISIMGVALVFFGKNKKSIILIIVLSLVFFVLFPQTMIADLLIRLARIFAGNDSVRVRLMDLADNLLSDTLGGYTGGRIDRYGESFIVFLKNPLFGVSGPFGDKTARLRGHSGWLDTLALFGLFTGIPLFAAIYFNIKKHLQFFNNTPYAVFIVITSSMFLLLGIINSTITVFPLGVMYFLIVPTIYFLPYAFVANEELPENLKTFDHRNKNLKSVQYNGLR